MPLHLEGAKSRAASVRTGVFSLPGAHCVSVAALPFRLPGTAITGFITLVQVRDGLF